MVDQAIVTVVRRYLQSLKDHGIPVSCGVVFGSQASGNANRWSDIDLIVISTLFDDPARREDVNQLWRIAARIDSRIEPIPCGEQQWRDDTASAILEIGRRDGARIEPARGA
ncbi:MAG: nucleotidyltransferase domain-containing protein [Candidatus Eisenbacteria sp.]|nr:nucleotidyltransferase domain-containing protein [Candidatus Eisenbacteria bacterium]